MAEHFVEWNEDDVLNGVLKYRDKGEDPAPGNFSDIALFLREIALVQTANVYKVKYYDSTGETPVTRSSNLYASPTSDAASIIRSSYSVKDYDDYAEENVLGLKGDGSSLKYDMATYLRMYAPLEGQEYGFQKYMKRRDIAPTQRELADSLYSDSNKIENADFSGIYAENVSSVSVEPFLRGTASLFKDEEVEHLKKMGINVSKVDWSAAYSLVADSATKKIADVKKSQIKSAISYIKEHDTGTSKSSTLYDTVISMALGSLLARNTVYGQNVNTVNSSKINKYMIQDGTGETGNLSVNVERMDGLAVSSMSVSNTDGSVMTRISGGDVYTRRNDSTDSYSVGFSIAVMSEFNRHNGDFSDLDTDEGYDSFVEQYGTILSGQVVRYLKKVFSSITSSSFDIGNVNFYVRGSIPNGGSSPAYFISVDMTVHGNIGQYTLPEVYSEAEETVINYDGIKNFKFSHVAIDRLTDIPKEIISKGDEISAGEKVTVRFYRGNGNAIPVAAKDLDFAALHGTPVRVESGTDEWALVHPTIVAEFLPVK